jgi:hypothetical protein
LQISGSPYSRSNQSAKYGSRFLIVAPGATSGACAKGRLPHAAVPNEAAVGKPNTTGRRRPWSAWAVGMVAGGAAAGPYGYEFASTGSASAPLRDGFYRAGVLRPWIRPQMLTWGATSDETSRSYPLDELVPKPDGGATMATFLPAPPEKVWPWLVQMGGDRGGWYSWDWLDNKGKSSADRVVPEWENLEIGRRLKGPTNWWTVVALPACQLPTGSSPCTSLSANSSIMLRCNDG